MNSQGFVEIKLHNIRCKTTDGHNDDVSNDIESVSTEPPRGKAVGDPLWCEECENEPNVPYVKFNDDDVQLTKVKCDYAPVEIQSIMSKYKDHDENEIVDLNNWDKLEKL